jgi:hypothetical protein
MHPVHGTVRVDLCGALMAAAVPVSRVEAAHFDHRGLRGTATPCANCAAALKLRFHQLRRVAAR